MDLEFCTVVQNLGMVIEDTYGDSDRNPDYRDITGDVTFTPVVTAGQSYKVSDESGRRKTVVLGRIRARIVDGMIWHEGSEGISLYAGGENSNPDKVVYRVEYSNLMVNRESVTLNGLIFEAVPGETIDLTDVTPVAGVAPAGIVKGDPFTYEDFTPEQLEDLIQQIRDEVLASIGGTIPDPDPVDPEPVDPEPVDPEPVDPDPVDPVDPVDPDPVDPEPVDPEPVDPEPVDPEPDPTEVEAPAPSWTDNSDGGGIWTTPVVEGIEYNPASGTAKPGQIVTVTATALDGYVLLGATGWTHRFPVAPGPVEYSFAIRADTAPVNDRKQIYALTAEKWAALSYLRDKTASHADPLGALNVALRTDASEIVGVTSVPDRALVEDGETKLGQVRSKWLQMASYRTPAYATFVADIGPVIDEISTKGVLI